MFTVWRKVAHRVCEAHNIAAPLPQTEFVKQRPGSAPATSDYDVPRAAPLWDARLFCLSNVVIYGTE